MKNKILILSTTLLFLAVIITSCKKENGTPSDNTAEASIQSDDQSRFSNESEAVANDADGALEVSPSFSGRLDRSQVVVCDASLVFDSLSNPRTITITYNASTSCNATRTRTGVVVLSMAQGVHWKDAGAAVSITYQNLKITRLSDNKSITINGTQTYTNVTGGLLFNLVALGTVTHTFTSNNMAVTFDDNTQRSWQVAEQRVFTYNNGVVISTSGTHTEGNNTNIAEWGINRLGHTFASSTVTPLVIRQDCSFRVVSGEVKHVTPNVTATATFGLDATGVPTACPGSGHYYLKVVWTGPGGTSLTVILPY
ncbi:MAG TPA: hypothetical protein VK588_02585 [Chitinophagaceae bacterium]|nr:hypothetical protein [Chitinophagaceae bacterium]